MKADKLIVYSLGFTERYFARLLDYFVSETPEQQLLQACVPVATTNHKTQGKPSGIKSQSKAHSSQRSSRTGPEEGSLTAAKLMMNSRNQPRNMLEQSVSLSSVSYEGTEFSYARHAGGVVSKGSKDHRGRSSKSEIVERFTFNKDKSSGETSSQKRIRKRNFYLRSNRSQNTED